MEAMKAAPRPAALPASDVIEDTALGTGGDTIPSACKAQQDLLWRHVGGLRARPLLEHAVAQLQEWAGAVGACRSSRGNDQELRSNSSIVTAGLFIAGSALRRTESRGAHFRTGFPSRRNLHWKKCIAERPHVD